ncbi:GNAT family N-acetyltransferase [Fictibacillus sp. NRS-1165]|uniref:GNAT family N-acetyltransferase n=1 Tax=Fictibacillus sp. NRS-1165 TaxID=3144463 RepID=UPI003D23B420
MFNVEIRRPSIKDVSLLHEFFRIVITDTFSKEGIGEKLEDLNEEIERKKDYLENDLNSEGLDRYFLIALVRDQMVGSIEFGPVSELIRSCTKGALKELMEIGTVFVHRDCQGQGIGNLLLSRMYATLQNRGINEFCLDSGYQSAQKIWTKKFGEPDYRLKDYWDKGYDHMIWRVGLQSMRV